MSQLKKIMEARKSSRSYRNEAVDQEVIETLIEAAELAPSGKNRKPWRFVVLNDGHAIKSIASLTKYSRFIRNAPLLILVYSLHTEDYPVEKDIFSIGACVQNMLLVATEKQYGTCVIGEVFGKEEAVDKILNTQNSNLLLVCGICVGKS